MHHTASSAIIRILAVLCLASTFDRGIAAEARWLDYNRKVKLRGIIVRQFDMSFVDSDISPVTDPFEAEKLAKQEQKKGPPPGAISKEPVLHWILRLDSPISMRDGHNDSYPEERNVSEIDMGGPGINEGIHIANRAYGRTHFMVSGKLWHGCNVHHLRPVMMELASVRLIRKGRTKNLYKENEEFSGHARLRFPGGSPSKSHRSNTLKHTEKRSTDSHRFTQIFYVEDCV